MSAAEERQLPEETPREAAPKSATQEPPMSGKKPRRRRRWLWRSLLVAAVLLIGARIALPYALPTILNSALADLELRAEYEDLSLSLLGASFELSRLELRDARSGHEDELHLQLDSALVDVDMSALLLGKLRVHRVHVEGLDVYLHREASGDFTLAHVFDQEGDTTTADSSESEPAAPPSTEEEALDLRLPIEIRDLQLARLRIHVRDDACEPTVRTWIGSNVQLRDLGREGRETRLSVLMHGDKLLDRLSIEGTVRNSEREFQADLRVNMAGLHLRPVRQWLGAVGIDPRVDDLDAGLSIRLAAKVQEEDPRHADLDVSISGLQLRADAKEAAAIDSITAHARNVRHGALEVEGCELVGLRGDAVRETDGVLRIAGLRLTGAPSTEPGTTVASATSSDASSATRFLLERVELRDSALRLRDETVTPAAELGVIIESLRIEDVGTAKAKGMTPGRILLAAQLPGVAKSLKLEGEVAPFADTPAAELRLSLQQLDFSGLEQHLASAGLKRDGAATDLGLRISLNTELSSTGESSFNAELSELELSRKEEALLALRLARLSGLTAGPEGLRIASTELSGLRLPLRRDAEGEMHFAGLRTAPAKLRPQTSKRPREARPAQGVAARAPDLPALELASLRLSDSAIRFLDDAVAPSFESGLEELTLEVTGLRIGGAPAAADEAPAKLAMSFAIPGSLARASLTGSLGRPEGKRGLKADLALALDGLQASGLEPYLRPAGIESRLEGGSLKAKLQSEIDLGEEGLAVSAALRELSLTGSEARPWLGIQELSLAGLRTGAGQLTIDAARLQGARLHVTRDEARGLQLLGLRMLPRSGTQAPEAADPSRAATAAPATQSSATRLGLTSLRVDDCAIVFEDRAPGAPRAPVELHAAVEADALAFGPGAEPSQIRVRLSAPGNLETAELSGSATLDPKRLATSFALTVAGLEAGPLTSYLPEGVELQLTDGNARLDLEAKLRQRDEGGLDLQTRISNLELKEGDSPLLRLGSATVHIPEFDPAGKRIRIQELSVLGVETEVTALPEQRLALLGLQLSRVPAPVEQEAAPVAAPQAPVAKPGAGGRSAGEASNDPPKVDIEKFRIELAKLKLLDRSQGREPPGVEASFALFAPEKLTLAAPDEEELAPLHLRFEGAVDPLVHRLQSDLRLQLRGANPRLTAHIELRGIDGSQLTERMPSLEQAIDASKLTDGRISAELEVDFAIPRRHTLDFDLGRGFGLEATLADIAIRETSDGPVSAGIARAYVDVKRILPGRLIHVTRVEVEDIRGHASIKPEGIETLGVLVKASEAPDTSAGDSTADPKTAQPGAQQTETAKTEAPQPSPTVPGTELRIDSVSVHGLEFAFEDHTTEPVTRLPLTGLELELRQLSSRAMTHTRPMSFSLSVLGGDVELPKSQKASSLVMGILGSAANMVTGGGNEVELEKRPFLEEIALNGRLVFYPDTRGFVRGSISRLELLALRGMAKSSGVEIGSGLLDAGLRLEFKGNEGITAGARFSFEDLQVDEPPGGPISSYLKLPAPLNTVIFALKDQRDRIEIPLDVTVADGSLGAGQITREFIRVFGSLVTDAVASAPLRVTSAVTGALGLDSLFGGSDAPVEEQKVSISFSPASAGLSESERQKLAPILELLEGDEEIGVVLVHSFGKQDYERAMRLANPSKDETMALIQRLRQRRQELTRQRQKKAAVAKAQLQVATREEALEIVSELQAIDRRLGRTELALDDALGLLAPGSDRRAPRRALALAREIGEKRLEVLSEYLVGVLGKAAMARVELRAARTGKAQHEKGGAVLVVPRIRKLD